MLVADPCRHAGTAALTASLLRGYAAIDRLRTIGDPPPLTAVDNPTTRPRYKPVQMPMPTAQPASCFGKVGFGRQSRLYGTFLR